MHRHQRAFRTLISGLAAVIWLLTALSCADKEALPTPEGLLRQTWESYKAVYISPQGYVLDRSRSPAIVTSEAQSYALLRAVWMQDEPTFKRVLEWTNAHLKQPSGLYAWLWQPLNENGPQGKIVDANTATDADQDIAFALILAAHRFDQKHLLVQARELLQAIRTHCALPLSSGWFPSAGNWAVDQRIINISYFMPYQYAYFHGLDPEGGWLDVKRIGYDLLAQFFQASSLRLPPDFAQLTPDGTVQDIPAYTGLSGDFSFDAMRTYWRTAADCLLDRNPQACADPAHTPHAARLLARDGVIFSRYTVEGDKRDQMESLSFYGSLLPAFRLYQPALAEALLQDKLSRKAISAIEKNDQRYYDLNWIWFGMALDGGVIARETPRADDLAFGSVRADSNP